jgi:rhamnopyranosyl-N-acetylglucosaminyl-diphospho-decaprenol beta-1,3/1,4-galactofuranosyltransferase
MQPTGFDQGQAGGEQRRVRPQRHRDSLPLHVTAVIVTHDRRELLLESLASVGRQSRQPDSVIVVDNASTDGTAEAVSAQFPLAQLVSLPANTGGAGGFAYGLALALASQADLAWLMDDDTIPRERALEALLDARGSYPGSDPAVIASQVLWTDGLPHPMNTPRTRPFATKPELAAAAAAGCRPIRSASFVSILVDAAACHEHGLPQADYFLWNDDFEFTARLLRRNPGLFCPASVVVHKTATFGSTDTDPGPRFYYEVRNKVWTLRSALPLGPGERVLYGGATVRRWARTFARSPNHRALAASLARGLADGLRTRPRPTEDVFESAGLARPLPLGLGDRGRGSPAD